MDTMRGYDNWKLSEPPTREVEEANNIEDMEEAHSILMDILTDKFGQQAADDMTDEVWLSITTHCATYPHQHEQEHDDND